MVDIESKGPAPMTAGERAVRQGAAIGLTLGWLSGLIYILVWVPQPLFDPKLVSFTDGVLLGVPVAGAALGAVLGWLLRNWDRFADLVKRLRISPAAPSLGPKGRNWRSHGWKIGTVVGLLLASQYLRGNSPLGFYTGSIALVYELFVPICAFIGAGIGWYMTLPAREDPLKPPD
jgi:hypothetical protein